MSLTETEWNDCLNTAHAFLVAQITRDGEGQQYLEDNFIKPLVERGDALHMVYAFSTVAAYTIGAVCKIIGVHPVEILSISNEAKEILMDGYGYVCMVCGHFQREGNQCEICMSPDLRKV